MGRKVKKPGSRHGSWKRKRRPGEILRCDIKNPNTAMAEESAKALGFRSYGAYLLSSTASTIATHVITDFRFCRCCASEDQPTHVFHAYPSQAALIGNDNKTTSVLCRICFNRVIAAYNAGGYKAAHKEVGNMIGEKRRWMDECRRVRNRSIAEQGYVEELPHWREFRNEASAVDVQPCR